MLRVRHPFRSWGGEGRGGPRIVWDMDPAVKEREGGGACAEQNRSVRGVIDECRGTSREGL